MNIIWFLKRRAWKRKSFVTAGKTWPVKLFSLELITGETIAVMK
jgi:hypothetical protein